MISAVILSHELSLHSITHRVLPGHFVISFFETYSFVTNDNVVIHAKHEKQVQLYMEQWEAAIGTLIVTKYRLYIERRTRCDRRHFRGLVGSEQRSELGKLPLRVAWLCWSLKLYYIFATAYGAYDKFSTFHSCFYVRNRK